jgi:hypothetical protein
MNQRLTRPAKCTRSYSQGLKLFFSEKSGLLVRVESEIPGPKVAISQSLRSKVCRVGMEPISRGAWRGVFLETEIS